jgi:hypothetical protein
MGLVDKIKEKDAKQIAKELLTAGIGMYVSYWVPSKLQEQACKKFGVNSQTGTYTSSTNGFYTAAVKLAGGIPLVATEDYKLAGIAIIASSTYSLTESIVRGRIAQITKRPVPGMVVVGLEYLWDNRQKYTKSLENVLV